MKNSEALKQLTLVRLREFMREPEAVFWVLGFPLIISAGLGLAFRNQPAQVLSIAATTPQLVAALKQEKLLDVRELDVTAAAAALRAGKIALVVEPGQQGGAVALRYDDSNPEGRTARMLADGALQRVAGRVDPVAINDVTRREPGSRYIDFLVPGLLGMNLMGSSIWSLGFTIVEARRRKLIKRLTATPMPRYAYLLSFLFSRLIMLVVEVTALAGFGWLVFGVPFRGSLIELAFLCIAGALTFGAMGLLMASRARTIEGVSGLMNLVQMPMWIVSGIFFSAQRFPDALRPFIRILPLTAIIDALRANILQGAHLQELSQQLAVLAVWSVICFVLALKLFRWR